MPPARTSPEEQHKIASAARDAARRATGGLAEYGGAPITSCPAFQGAETTIRNVDPLAGMRAARQIELATRQRTAGYIRTAREDGRTWHDIGISLGIVRGGDASQAGESVTEGTCTYAAGNPDSETARRYGRSFTWTCRSCDRPISDRGLDNGPAEDEHGHAENCARLAATIAAWHAEWEAG